MSESTFKPQRCKTGQRGELYVFCFTLTDRLDLAIFSQLDREIQILPCFSGEISALFIEIDPEDWTGQRGEENLKNLEWVGREAVWHEKVVERTMVHSPVVPLRFGTLFTSRSHLQTFMKDHSGALLQLLIYLEDKSEWDVKGYLYRQKSEDYFLPLESSFSSTSPSSGTDYLQRNLLRSRVKKQISQWLRGREKVLLTELSSEAAKWCALGKIPGGPEKEREMVFRWTFLLKETRLHPFLKVLDRGESEDSPKGLILEFSGPWPAYHFCPQLGKS